MKRNVYSLIIMSSLLYGCGSDSTENKQTETENLPPIIAGQTNYQNINEGDDFNLEFSFVDPNNDDLTLSIENKPDWLTFNTTTGESSGVSESGTFNNIHIVVSDGEFSSRLGPITITVDELPIQNTNNRPTINGSLIQSTFVADDTINFTPISNDSDNDDLSFFINGKPSWMTFNPSTGSISGIAEEGNYSITLGVTDGDLSAVLNPLNFNVIQNNFSIEITWENPTLNTKSEPLTNLAGSVVNYYNTATPEDINVITIDDSNTNSFIIDDLKKGEYEFFMKSKTTQNVFSDESNKIQFNVGEL